METVKINPVWNQCTFAHDWQLVPAVAGFTPQKLIADCQLSFVRPYYLLVNGQAVSKREYDEYQIQPNDICHFVELPPLQGGGQGGSNPLQVLATIVVMVASAYTGGAAGAAWGALAGKIAAGVVMVGGMMIVNAAFAQSPASQGALGQADQVYSINGARNRYMLDSPWPEHFGRLRVFPEVLIPPYVAYYGAHNEFAPSADQYLFVLLSLGVGSFEIEKLMITDTDIENLTDVEYHVIEPGGTHTIVDRIIWPNDNLNGQLLNSRDEQYYYGTGDNPNTLSTIINPANSVITNIGWDMEFPAGCYTNSNGTILPAYLLFRVYVRLVDDEGEPLDSSAGWTALTENSRVIDSAGVEDPADAELISIASINVHRASYYKTAPLGPGRYEIKFEGFDRDVDNSISCNKCYLGQIRGYGTSWPDHGNVTKIEMRIKATSQISGAVADKINFVGTRKLYPVTSSGFGPTLTATRCPIDAVAYAVCSSNAGRQPGNVPYWSALYTLKQTLAASNYYFDWRVESRIKVMEFISTVGRCCIAVPFMPSGRLALIQDVPKTVNSMIFTEDDYDVNSLDVVHSMVTADDPTGVQVKYLDNTKWQNREVNCYDDDGSAENMGIMDLSGCTEEAQATDVGNYFWLVNKYGRSSIKFSTGLKGHIPTPLMRVGVAVPQAAWSYSGTIQKIDGTNIYLSTNVVFAGGFQAVMLITGENGDLLGPYDVDEGAAANIVVGTLPADVRTAETHGTEAAKFLFGAAESELLSILVTGIRPQGRNKIQIEGRIYFDEVYDY